MLPTLMRRVYFFYCGSRAVLQWYDAPRVTRRPAELLVETNQDSTLSDSPPLLFLFKDSSSYSRLPPPSSSPGERHSHSANVAQTKVDLAQSFSSQLPPFRHSTPSGHSHF